MANPRSPRISFPRQSASPDRSIDARRLPDQGQAVLFGLAIVALAFLAQSRALPGGFVWEDVQLIGSGSMVAAPDGLVRFWCSTEAADYWPVSYTTHWLEWRAWGNWAPGYRLVNLALHALNALLVWRIMARLKVRGAWLVGALFAVHPVNIEAVAWILQRKTVLSAAFGFGSLLCWLRFNDDARYRWYFAAMGLFLLGMLSKSAIVMWPCVLLLVRWWQARRLRRRDFARVLPFFAISLGLGIVQTWFQQSVAIADTIVRDDSLHSRLALAGWVVWFYVGKALWPLNLSFVYARWPLEPAGLVAWLPDLSLVAIFALAFRFRRGWGAAVQAGLGYYVLNLVPVMGLVNIYYMRFSLVADHWQYVALPGLIALVVGAISFTIEHSGWPAGRRIAWAGSALVVALLLAVSFIQGSIYSHADNETLWRDVLSHNPRCCLAETWLTTTLLDKGALDEAAQHGARALALHREDVAERGENVVSRSELATLYGNLGLVELRLGKPREALDDFEQARALDEQVVGEDPSYFPYRDRLGGAWVDRATALFALGADEQGLASLRQAVETREQLVRDRPDSIAYRSRLAQTCTELALRLGATEEARRLHSRALVLREELVRASPRDLAARVSLGWSDYNLGLLEFDQGNATTAAKLFRQAIDVRSGVVADFPDEADYLEQLAWAQVRLGLCEQKLGRLRESASMMAQALDTRTRLLTLGPDVPRYVDELAASHVDVGLAEQSLGHTVRAVEHLRHAVTLRQRLAASNAAEWRINLAATYATLARLEQAQGNTAQAAAASEQAVALRRELAQELPNDPLAAQALTAAEALDRELREPRKP